MEFGVEGLVVRSLGSGCRVQGAEFRIEGSGETCNEGHGNRSPPLTPLSSEEGTA